MFFNIGLALAGIEFAQSNFRAFRGFPIALAGKGWWTAR